MGEAGQASSATDGAVSEGHVLVTGGSRGIGRAVVEDLLTRGATVGVVARDLSPLEPLRRETEDRLHLFRADLAKPKERDALMGQVLPRMGHLDGLVQSAGLVRYGAVGEMNEAHLHEHFALNFVAPTLLAQQVAMHLCARQVSGAIVNVASNLGLRSVPTTGAYAASKAALMSMTKTMALELAEKKVRVNAVAPGIIDTDMVRGPRGDQIDALGKLHPLGRLGTAEEVAQAVRYLLDAPFVTGEVLVMDGGWMLTGR